MRIAGATIPDGKRAEIALTYVYGIGLTRAREVLRSVRVSPDTRVKNLSAEEIGKIQTELNKYVIEGELRRVVSSHIKRLRDIKTYRGMRHGKHLPVRGQRTKTNSRTVRGNVRVTMGSGRRKLEKT